MALLGTLNVNLTATTKGLERGMKRGGKVVKRGIAQFKGLAVAALAAAGITGIGAVVKAMDDLAKTSDKLAIDPHTLLAFQFAAKKSGVEANVLNTALQRMERRASEAVHGNAKLVEVFDELGISTRDLARLKPADIFRRIGLGIVTIIYRENQIVNAGIYIADKTPRSNISSIISIRHRAP